MHVTMQSVASFVCALSFTSMVFAQPEGEAPRGPASEAQAARDAEQATAVSLMDQEARQHFQLGKALYDAGRFPEAAREFEEAYKLSKRPQLLYNLYVAHRDASNWPSAIESLRAYLEQVPDAADRVNLRARLKSMEDTQKKQAEQQALAEAQAKEAEQRAKKKEEPATRTETVRSVVPYVLMGVGGALVVTGGVTGIVAQGKSNDLDAACTGDDRCPSSEQDNIDSLKTLAITTDVLLGAGILTAGTGLVLWLTGALDSERQVPVAALSCGKDECGLTLTGRF